MPIRLVCIIEAAGAETVEDAVLALEAFQAAVLPSAHGLTVWKARPEDLATALGRRGGKVRGGAKQEAAQRNGMAGGRPIEHGRRRGKLARGRLVYVKGRGWGRITNKRFDGTFVVTLRDGGEVVETVESQLLARLQRRVLGPGKGKITVRKRRKDRKPKKRGPKS